MQYIIICNRQVRVVSVVRLPVGRFVITPRGVRLLVPPAARESDAATRNLLMSWPALAATFEWGDPPPFPYSPARGPSGPSNLAGLKLKSSDLLVH